MISKDRIFLEHAKRFISNINSEIIVHTLDNATDLRSALNTTDQLDVVVCDHDPPSIDAISIYNDMSRINDLRPFIIMTKKSDGEVAIKAFELKMDYYVSRENVMNFYMDLASKIVLCAERRRIEYDRQLNENRMNALVYLAKMHDKEFGDILNYALESSVSLTNSMIGYIAMYDNVTGKLKMAAWSMGGLDKCKMKNRQITYDFDSTGVWGEPIRKNKAVIINDYANESEYHKNGTPPGHVALNRLLMIPILHNGKILATAGVGNKIREYTDDDVVQFSLLMDGLMSIYHERMLEEESNRKERNMREIMENAPVGILIVDKDLNITEENDYARSMIIGHSLCLLKGSLKSISNEFSRIIVDDINKVSESGVAETFEHSIDGNGSIKNLNVKVAGIKDISGAIMGFTVILDDVTAAYRASMMLRQTMERVNMLDSVINDSIRKLLGDLDDVVGRMPESDDRSEVLKHIMKLNDIMMFVNEYHDIGLLDTTWQDFDQIVKYAIEVGNIDSQIVDYSVKGIKILADPAFYSVFTHLLIYSIAQGVRVSKCTIKCKTDNGDLVIRYRDNGIGIPDDKKSDFTSGVNMDYGLGIYVVFNILRATGFSTVEKGEPGKGIDLEIRIPSSNYSIDWD